MSKALSYKTVMAIGIVFFCVVLIAVTGCSSHHKKRGIVFRGDWAFEINRTPWVGHPGNTDLPGMENNAKKDHKSLCTKDKDSSLGNSLLGPLASLRSKCRCKNCVTSNGNINITSYNPTIANTFPNPMTGAYPGTFPPGSLSLPHGAIVVPTGVLMPNGTILPHHFFYSQAATVYGNVNPATGQGHIANLNAGQQGQTPPQPGQATQQSQTQQSQGNQDGNSTNTPATQPPQLQAPVGNAANSVTVDATTGNMGGNMIAGTLPQGQMAVTAPSISPEMQNYLMQPSMQANLNPDNPMLVNPALAQVMPEMSMTGIQSPGYPPIGYAPTGYSPGYAQQLEPPPLAGPLGTVQPAHSQALASVGSSQAGASSHSEPEEEPVEPKHVASMPYPRHHPVPIRPVYQRQMGMAPGYQAMRPPMTSPYMMPGMGQNLPPNMMMQNQYPGQNMYGMAAGAMGMSGGMSPQAQISQAAAMQERQLMLERQRQALIMQQNASVQQSLSRQGNKTAASRKRAAEMDEDDESTAPAPPASRILLANHQAPILQPPTQRVSQAPLPPETSSKKKLR